MTEKVKVTQEQFDWLERYKSDEEINYAIDIHPHKKRPDSPIADWMPSEIAQALYNGYEVKQTPLKIGDWAKVEFRNGGKAIGVIDTTSFDDVIFNYLDIDMSIHRIRKNRAMVTVPTPEEIKQEKERRLWKSIGREVGEFWDGDIALDRYGKVLHRQRKWMRLIKWLNCTDSIQRGHMWVLRMVTNHD